MNGPALPVWLVKVRSALPANVGELPSSGESGDALVEPMERRAMPMDRRARLLSVVVAVDVAVAFEAAVLTASDNVP